MSRRTSREKKDEIQDEQSLILKDSDMSLLVPNPKVEHVVFEGFFKLSLVENLSLFPNLKSLSIFHTGVNDISNYVKSYFRSNDREYIIPELKVYCKDRCLIHKVGVITDSDLTDIPKYMKSNFHVEIIGSLSESMVLKELLYTEIESLAIMHVGIGNIDLRLLDEMKNLTHFEILTFFKEEIKWPKNPTIKSFNIHIRDAWLRDLSFMSSWSNTHSVTILGNIKFPFFQLQPEKRLELQKEIKSATVDLTTLSGNEHILEFIIDADIMTSLILPALPNAKVIDIRKSSSPIIDLKNLAMCRELEKLYITHSSVRFFDLQHLKNLEHLELLCFTDNYETPNLARETGWGKTPIDYRVVLEMKSLKEILIPPRYSPPPDPGYLNSDIRRMFREQEDAFYKLLHGNVKITYASRDSRDPTKFKELR
ncbi:MAG: hypothetical protein RTV31_10435 [Candidatus Thorarchaeota archaeon]